ncbi:MAG: BlaI/MecI/CopY family transcriptional regulator [Myxococcales bacterium]|nr:BlaI/MecI/CopY family transcriptional regulator [Myxococcales bacterium]
MSRPTPPSLTAAELSALKALWALGPSTVAEVRRYLGDVSAYTTVMTLLSRLAQKNAVVVDRAREPFLYTANVSRDQVQGAGAGAGHNRL